MRDSLPQLGGFEDAESGWATCRGDFFGDQLFVLCGFVGHFPFRLSYFGVNSELTMGIDAACNSWLDMRAKKIAGRKLENNMISYFVTHSFSRPGIFSLILVLEKDVNLFYEGFASRKEGTFEQS